MVLVVDDGKQTMAVAMVLVLVMTVVMMAVMKKSSHHHFMWHRIARKASPVFLARNASPS